MKGFFIYPLQFDVTAFQMDSTISAREAIIFGIVAGAVIIAILIYNVLLKKKAPATKTGSSKIVFSGFALRRLIKNLDLSHEQRKMLDFVFKTDNVADPEKSLSTPDLLDRHFSRAYRIIQQTSKSSAETLRKHALLFSTRNVLENSIFGGLTSTRQLKEDTALTITHGKEKLNLNIVSIKAEQLAVETPKSVLGSHLKIPQGTKLSVMFFTKNNKGFTFETRVTGFSTTMGQSTMLLAHSNQVKFLSQRRYRRKQAVIACFLYIVYVEGSGKKQRLVVDKRRLSGSIADISVGGCSIKVTAPVNVGARLKIEFTQGDGNVAALGQVLRTNRTGISTILHIKFLRVTQKSMNLINAFVYEYGSE